MRIVADSPEQHVAGTAKESVIAAKAIDDVVAGACCSIDDVVVIVAPAPGVGRAGENQHLHVRRELETRCREHSVRAGASAFDDLVRTAVDVIDVVATAALQHVRAAATIEVIAAGVAPNVIVEAVARPANV
jgi:hypothetical protein